MCITVVLGVRWNFANKSYMSSTTQRFICPLNAICYFRTDRLNQFPVLYIFRHGSIGLSQKNMHWTVIVINLLLKRKVWRNIRKWSVKRSIHDEWADLWMNGESTNFSGLSSKKTDGCKEISKLKQYIRFATENFL